MWCLLHVSFYLVLILVLLCVNFDFVQLSPVLYHSHLFYSSLPHLFHSIRYLFLSYSPASLLPPSFVPLLPRLLTIMLFYSFFSITVSILPHQLSLFPHLLYSSLTCTLPHLFSSPYFVSLFTSVSFQSTKINLFCTSPSSLVYCFFFPVLLIPVIPAIMVSLLLLSLCLFSSYLYTIHPRHYRGEQVT